MSRIISTCTLCKDKVTRHRKGNKIDKGCKGTWHVGLWVMKVGVSKHEDNISRGWVTCKLVTHIFIFLQKITCKQVLCCIFSAGCLMAFVSNDRITDTVESYKTTPVRAIRDAEQYFNETLNVSGSWIWLMVDYHHIVAHGSLKNFVL
jgi:predicted small secreted protein